MDFDEYDYLEKMVDNPEPKKIEETENGGREIMKSGEKDQSRSSKHKSDDDRSRRQKTSNESRDHGRSREKGSSRHRSRSRDGEKDRDRGSTEHRERERHRDRYKEREKRNVKDKDRVRENDRHNTRHNDRDRDKDKISHERDSERVNERERETERPRRSRSPSGRYQDQDEKEKGRGREYRERDGDLRDRNKENRRKKEEGAEPEADPERDQRTVFAYQITIKANERDVYEFFSRAGKVRDVRLIMDRNTRRSKGVGYVEFYDVMSVPMAIALSGQPLLGQPVMVKPSEAEKNLVQSTAAGSAGLTGPQSAAARKLYVGNLHTNITEDQLRQVFESFGPVELVQLPLDETGHSKGFGFVQFAQLDHSRNALIMNGNLELAAAGRAIKVSAVTDQTGIQDVGTNTGDLDDDEGGGLSLNAHSRAILMQKLDRSGTAPSPAVTSAGVTSLVPPTAQNSAPALYGLPGTGLQIPNVSVPLIDTIGTPSECLLLKNMFDPKLETEADFDLDIKEDVREECSKFGNLKHIFVDKNSAGFVYLRFENTESATKAQRALHGRWFAGKMITATYMVPQTYETEFPESR